MDVEQFRGSNDQFVVFRLGKEELAVPIYLVQEIIKPSQITRVPKSPPYLSGMSNLRGEILPVVELRQRLGLEVKAQDEHTRIIVLNFGESSLGITVDSVSEVLTIEEGMRENPPAMVSGFEGQVLRAMAKLNGGKRLVLILNETKFLPETLTGADVLGHESEKKMAGQVSVKDSRVQEDVEQLVTFEIMGEEYAIEIMLVKEIIKVPNIMPVPKAPDYVLGVMSLRGQLLPVIDLRKKFEYRIDDKKVSESARIVVVEWQGVRTGLRVDSVSQVLRLELNSIDKPPRMVGKMDSNCLKGIGKLNNGKRLIMLLDMAAIMPQEDFVADLEGAHQQLKDASSDDRKRATGEEIQLVCFKVNNEEYGFDIMSVQEIIRLREVTGLPQTKNYIEGIINLRGNVVPVVDMRKRFDMEEGERSTQNRVIVVNIEGRTTGMIVDSVTEVLRIAKDQVEDPPRAVAGVDGRFFEGIGKLNSGKRMIILIKLESLLSEVTLAA